MDEGGKEGAGMIEKKYDVMAFILSYSCCEACSILIPKSKISFDSRAQNRRSQGITRVIHDTGRRPCPYFRF